MGADGRQAASQNYPRKEFGGFLGSTPRLYGEPYSNNWTCNVHAVFSRFRNCVEGKGKAVNILGQGGIRFNTVNRPPLFWGYVLVHPCPRGNIVSVHCRGEGCFGKYTPPEAQEISQGWGFCTPRPERLPEGHVNCMSTCICLFEGLCMTSAWRVIFTNIVPGDHIC